jgi:hypothetical protein
MIFDYWKNLVRSRAKRAFINTVCEVIRQYKLSPNDTDRVLMNILNTGLMVDLNKAKHLLSDYVQKLGKKRF